MATVSVPLFPGYVFCRFDPSQRTIPVVTTSGVVRLLGFGTKPEPVSENVIRSLRISTTSGIPLELWPFVEPGDQVEIRDGALAGVIGTLIELKKRYRVVVSVPLLQRAVAIEIDGSWVRPLPASPEKLSRSAREAGTGAR